MAVSERRGEQTWQTNITELMGILCDALTALTPSLDRARIPWRLPDAYDDWDNIASALFENIVINSIRWTLAREPRDDLKVPKYGLRYPDYSGLSFVEVVPLERSLDSYLVFVEYESTQAPFDSIDCVMVNRNGSPARNSVESIMAAGSRFRFQLRERSGELTPVDDLTVLL